MHHLARVTGIAFLVCGILEVVFGALSVLGVALGATLMFGGGPGQSEELGPLLFWLYLIMGFGAIGGAGAHLYAAVRMLAGQPPAWVIWVGTVGSILPLVTVYCALPTLVAGMLGLVLLLLPEKGEETA